MHDEGTPSPAEVVRDWIERFNAADPDALARRYHPEAVNHQGFFTVKDGLILAQRGYWDRLSFSDP